MASECVRLALGQPTGDALCTECCTKFVEKEGNYNGKTIRKKDVVALERSGTGFVGSGTQIEAKRFEHLGVGSGLADVRGQSAGPSSKFGLVYR
jgi:nitric oxide synthase-interacting protein